jgi:hypothetical protein
MFKKSGEESRQKESDRWIYFILTLVSLPLVGHLIAVKDIVSLCAVALTIFVAGWMIKKAFRKKELV